MSFYWICPRQFTAWLYTVLQRNVWEINQRVLKSETETEISKFCKLYWDLEEEVSTVLSVQFSRSVMSGSLRPHESQHTRPPCPSPTPGVHSDSRPLSQWCHPAISSSVVPFSSCPQSLPASESFPLYFITIQLCDLRELSTLQCIGASWLSREV